MLFAVLDGPAAHEQPWCLPPGKCHVLDLPLTCAVAHANEVQARAMYESGIRRGVCSARTRQATGPASDRTVYEKLQQIPGSRATLGALEAVSAKATWPDSFPSACPAHDPTTGWPIYARDPLAMRA